MGEPRFWRLIMSKHKGWRWFLELERNGRTKMNTYKLFRPPKALNILKHEHGGYDFKLGKWNLMIREILRVSVLPWQYMKQGHIWTVMDQKFIYWKGFKVSDHTYLLDNWYLYMCLLFYYVIYKTYGLLWINI